MGNRFYVYAYLRSRDSQHGLVGSPYYIGKGQRRRAWDKLHVIKPPSDPTRIVILSDHMTSVDALQAEMLLIHLYGRIDKGTGCLRNLTDGGDGCRGAQRSEHTRHKLSEKTKKEWDVKRAIGYQYPPVSDETRAKFRAAKVGKKQTRELVERRTAPLRGRKRSKETLEKIAAAKRKTERSLIQFGRKKRKIWQSADQTTTQA